MIKEGSVYKLTSSESSFHFHIVTFRDPLGRDSVNIVLYISSSTTLIDPTCTFKPGEDFFISKPSWVKYRNCKVLSDMDLERLKPIGIVSDKTLEKIKRGFELALGHGKIDDYPKFLYLKWKDDLLFSHLK